MRCVGHACAHNPVVRLHHTPPPRQGDFQHGKRHGYGVYTYADGGRFEGEWIDDKVHGRGVSVYASGNCYEGEWVDGKINGQVRACRVRVRVHAAAE